MVIVGTLIGGALLIRRLLESRSIDLTSLPPSNAGDTVPQRQTVDTFQLAQSKSLLERLIKHELPISVESVEFPAMLVLQGRIAQKPILRVDGPQSILKQNGPHFGPSDRKADDTVLNETIAQLDAPEVAAVRRPHFIDSERHKVVTPATTSADQNAGIVQNDDSVKAPLAKALFQLEQGGHS